MLRTGYYTSSIDTDPASGGFKVSQVSRPTGFAGGSEGSFLLVVQSAGFC